MVSKANYLEQDIIESPGLSSEHGWETNLTPLYEECEVDSTGACIPSCPGLAGSSIGCMAVGSKGLAINPSLRNRIDGLTMGQTPDENYQTKSNQHAQEN